MKVPYNLNDLDFAKEWLQHVRIHEWWYATGILKDGDDNLYSYQYTVIHTNLKVIKPWILMLAITDFKNQKHYYEQKFQLFGSSVKIEPLLIEFLDTRLRFGEEGVRLTADGEDFRYAFKLNYGKNPIWHCDNGKLRMGTDHPDDTTFYYSYTRLPTEGTITLDGRLIDVKGHTWFDKQGGPFRILKPETHWEWFSWRLDSGEELMLFVFPRDQSYNDGTFVDKDGKTTRVRGYTVTADAYTEVNGMKFSKAWHIHIPGFKGEDFTIRPLMDGQLNLAYFEEVCEVYDKDGQKLGLTFVELLPGVYNDEISPLGFFKKA